MMAEDIVFVERISSNKTRALFLTLTGLFFMLFIWRVNANGIDVFAAVFTFFFIIFVFYSLNYRTLILQIRRDALKLKFGIFSWVIALNNIEYIQLDELPSLMKYGGAGIHFMTIRNRYRASFNFLEYPRVVVSLKKKSGLVQDISFSTVHPEEFIRVIERMKGI